MTLNDLKFEYNEWDKFTAYSNGRTGIGRTLQAAFMDLLEGLGPMLKEEAERKQYP